ncbi:HIT family protein [Sulfurospirillum deleyianum]|uniref:HIT family protein n=1 Tax=Sulfurospirillum deleyianum (strain ATCC 51133 / DSM 6946 / 5175) TaxID=525898 RepID=D1B3N6_SULD5|nr:HIT family protein [Sulfurospirillum deleyianum]ACZ12706.1 HIT family protein [Sulfurospirillum deleyianum DSM 6946]
MSTKLYENPFFYVEKEESTIPWVKIFTQKPYKELSDCDATTQHQMLQAMLCTEEIMRAYYHPTKINIAMFGNYLPHLHIHVMARFMEDSHFPESMWGIQQRESAIKLPNFEDFATLLSKKLSNL